MAANLPPISQLASWEGLIGNVKPSQVQLASERRSNVSTDVSHKDAASVAIHLAVLQHVPSHSMPIVLNMLCILLYLVAVG